MRVVEKLAGVPAIYTGGARGEIAATLTQRGSVYGLIDVPAGTPSAPNGTLFGAPVFWPSGLVDAARAAGADVLLLTSHCDADGRRRVVAERLAAARRQRHRVDVRRAHRRGAGSVARLAFPAGLRRIGRRSAGAAVIYRRSFDPASGDSLARLSRWIRPGTTVLELGAAAGYFTEWLKQQGATVDVVDVDPEAGRAAQPFARRVVVADLDADGWEAELAAAGSSPRYDFIVCADVLEHLRDGARLLARLRPLLAPAGELLLSVPNVAHAAIIAGLFDDRFEYGGEGLLDPTHLHLYTWRSVGALLRDAGFRILDWDATELTPYATEFRTRVEGLVPALREALGAGTRHHAYQWLVRATPGSMREIPVPLALEGAERVPVRLLPGPTRDALTLDRQYVGFIPANGDAATIEWRFEPAEAVLRIILADRVGVIAIEDLTLLAGEREVWRFGAPGALLDPSFETIALGRHELRAGAPGRMGRAEASRLA